MESNNKMNNVTNENNNTNINNKQNQEKFQGEKYKKKSECPNFLLKLYQILGNDEYKDIIHWSDDGKYFIVKNLHDFTENILPKYYKHNNYSSFIRQLNMYDFHKRKSSPNEHIFEHKNFIKDKKELLKLIKRKTKKDNNTNINNNYNNNMLVHFSNYTPYITNKLLPSKEAEIMSNIPNSNENKIIFNNNNDRKNSFSIDDNLSANNSIHSIFQYKPMPPLLPMGPIPQTIQNNNNYNNNYYNNNNYNYNTNFKNINLNSEIKEDKKITKKNLQNLLNYLMQSIQENTQMEKQLELKIERLTNQNNEFMTQNKKMLEEIISKNEYNKKLEAVICFVLEIIMSKSKMKNNPELKNLFLSNEANNQYHDNNNPNLNKLGLVNFNGTKHDINSILPNDFLTNNNGAILEPFQAFLNKYYERSKNTGFLTNKENYMNNQEIAKYNNNILLDDDKYYYPINDQNSNTKLLKKNLIGDQNEDNYKNNYQISPYMLNNKRKRSSSFNSILSNLSKGSNVVYSNNKLLPEEDIKDINQNKEEKINDVGLQKIEEKKDDKSDIISSNFNFSRKDSISSWNDGKNVFDIDLNQDENKSYISGWNKDILNNSQSSFNDIDNNNTLNINKDNDILSDINDIK